MLMLNVQIYLMIFKGLNCRKSKPSKLKKYSNKILIELPILKLSW